MFSEWAEEARSCILAQRLTREAAANFLLSYFDDAARLEVRCRPSAVQKDAGFNRSIGRCVWRQGKHQPAVPSVLLPEAGAQRADCVLLTRLNRHR